MSGVRACESRAFCLIDAVDSGSLVWLRRALLQLGDLLALGLNTPPPLGLAVMKRMPGKQSSQCNILLRPGSTFQLKEYLAALKRVAAADTTDAADGNMLGAAVMALLQHMMKQPGGNTCHNHVIVISGSFQSSPKMQQVLEFTRQVRASIHFLQLAGPAADPLQQQMSVIQLAEGLDQAVVVQEQQQGHTATSRAVQFEQAVAASAPHVTYDYFAADCSAVSDLLCQCWLRELMTHSTTKKLCTPDVVLKLGQQQQQQIPCTLHQHILPLDSWVMPARLCPCHQQPMQPPAGSATAVQAVAAAASNPASAAGLLLLPEEAPWRCQVSGQLILQPHSGCRTDASVVQLGRHTQLRMAAATGGAATDSTHNPLAAAAAASMLPADQPMELHVRHVVSISRIDSMMLYGVPFIVSPAHPVADTALRADAAPAAAQEDALMFMRAFCELLKEQQQVLVASSHHDVIRRCYQPLHQWYILQPAADGCSLLLRYMASREQLLPPRGYKSMVSDDSEVVLLDADQLEAARSCLAQLQQRPLDSDALQCASADCSANATDVAGDQTKGRLHCEPAAAAAAVTEAAERQQVNSGDQQPVVVAAAVGVNSGPEEPGSSSVVLSNEGPLTLSCGLHEWMQTVVDSCAATYHPPPSGAAATTPPAVPPPIQVQQQQQQVTAADVHAAHRGSLVSDSNARLEGTTATTAPLPSAAATSSGMLLSGAVPKQQQQQQGNEPGCPPASIMQQPDVANARCIIRGVAGKTTTAAHLLQGLQAGQQSNGASHPPGAPAVAEAVSGRSQRRGRGRNALKLSSSASGSRHAG